PFSGSWKRNSTNRQNGTTSTEVRAKQTYSKMKFGFTLLKIDENENIEDIKYRFYEFSNKDIANQPREDAIIRFSEFINNDIINESDQKPKYIVKRAPENSFNKDNDAIDDLANRLKYGLLLPSLEFDSFGTSDKLEECVKGISHEIKEIDPQFSLQKKQLRICIFFGREVFTKIQEMEFDVKRWARFKRNGEGSLSTTYTHYHFSKIIDKIDQIKERFGLKERDEDHDKDKRSIRVFYTKKEKKHKLKLEWIEDVWKITRAAAAVERVSCVDIISGSDDPDLRLSVKSQYDYKWESYLDNMVKKLQEKPKTKNFDGLWFTCKDFSDFPPGIECVCVQQTFKKRCFYNDKFQLTIDTTCRDNGGKIKNEDSISVKHLSWRTNDDFDFEKTVFETFDFAKEIINFVN
ncbi:15284_t:CDS:2, partial [Racocetra persica]